MTKIEMFLAGIIGTVLLVLIMIFIAGCGGNLNTMSADGFTCKNSVEEFTVDVPYTWDVMDDEETTTQANGCTLTVITHYVLDTTGDGLGGSAPDPRHCDVDGCGGPLNYRSVYSDPAEHIVEINQIQEGIH